MPTSSWKGVIALNKAVKTADLYDCQVPYLKELFDSCEYPWEMLPKIKDWIAGLIEAGLPEFTEIKPGVWVGKAGSKRGILRPFTGGEPEGAIPCPYL